MMEKKEFIAILKRIENYCSEIEGKYIAGDVETAVRKWAVAHPVKTRQAKFLKQFPHAELDSRGNIYICPHNADITYKDCKCYICCDDCRTAYWGEEC